MTAITYTWRPSGESDWRGSFPTEGLAIANAHKELGNAGGTVEIGLIERYQPSDLIADAVLDVMSNEATDELGAEVVGDWPSVTDEQRADLAGFLRLSVESFLKHTCPAPIAKRTVLRTVEVGQAVAP